MQSTAENGQNKRAAEGEEYIRNNMYLNNLSRSGFTEACTCSLLQRMDRTNEQQKVKNILGIQLFL